MPRIDPERLLKCLQPLLEPISGAIRSTDEVDKILGLMSKFSKKLVSKCIYINILRASHQSVVDLFMDRGGWNLVFGWTNDAISNKNFPLLKEIFHLLLTTPVTVPRLKSNRFPIVIKNFSKECEDEETKNICKQVVSRWITVAKTEEIKTDQPQQQLVPPAPPPSSSIQEQQHLGTLTSTQPQHIQLVDPTANTGVGGVVSAGELPNLGSMNTDHLLNIDPSSMSMLPDADGGAHGLMDLDLTNSELAGIDFNLDILNKMVADGHMEDISVGGLSQQVIGGGDINTVEAAATATAALSAPISVIQHAPAQLQPQMQQQHLIHQQHHPQQQQHQIILEQQHVQIQQQQHPQIIQHSQQQLVAGNVISANTNVIFTSAHGQQHHHQQQPQQIIIQQQPQQQQTVIKEDPQQLVSLVPVQPANKLYIKTVGGQRSVVQNFSTDPGQYCLMMKDGKSYLVRLKEQPNVTNVVVTSANSPVTSVVVQQQQQQQNIHHTAMLSEVPDGSNNKVPPLIISSHHDTPDGAPVQTSNLKKVSKSPNRKDPQVVSPVNKVPGDMKTYSKSKSSSSSSSSKDGKKSSSENVKPSSSSSSEKDRHKSSSSRSKSSSSSDSHHHKKSSKSKAESAASKAAAAAAAAKEEERLKEKIRREKAQMKKRQKELAKQNEQTKKDQETLKKLNLIPAPVGSTTSSTASSTASGGSSSSSALKIGKIPKRNVSSFADAIGIPGSDGNSSTVDKIKKVSPEKSLKDSTKEKSPAPPNEDVVIVSPQKKFYGKREEEAAAEENKPKERRHNVKVFNRSKSRADDLLKEMTESGNKGSKSAGKDKEQKDKEKDEKEQGAGKMSGLSSLGNSIPATPPKISKRLSTDSLEKPGDVKKAKLETTKEKSSSGGGKESSKDKIKKVAPSSSAATKLKESSLFMDAISAGAETTKTVKKKRRTSSGGEKDTPKLGELSGEGSFEDAVATPTGEKEQEQVKKPVFNFYRDTLNDEDGDTTESKAAESGEGNEVEKNDGDEKMDEGANEAGSFTPQENDGKIKSALVLIRPRNRKKKFVRWREEDELREFHFFEMDETERVNVTKQKDFTELSSNEKAMEGSFLKRRAEEEEQGNNKNEVPWKMPKIIFTREILDPPIISTERDAQDEREKNVLGLFLPPGSALPETPEEPDQSSIETGGENKQDPRSIPVEDVNTITKVCDYRTHEWPDPKLGPTFGIGGMMMGRSAYSFPSLHVQHQQRNPMDAMAASPLSFPSSSQYPPQMVPNPTLSPTTTQPADYNPWNSNLGFSVPPTGVPPPVTTPDMGYGFGQFGATTAAAVLNMNLIGQGVPPPAAVPFPNPFALPPPPTAMMNGPPPVGGSGIMDYGTVNNHRGGGGGGGGNHRGGNGGSRFDGNDRRGNFHASRDNNRDKDRSTSRDRDYRDDRGGRDRDYRRGGADRSGSNDRDYRNHHDRDNNRNNRDFRGGGRNIRKEIPCRFFKKGFCGNGDRCEFLHEGGPSATSRSSNDRSTSSRRSPPSISSHHQSSTSSSNSNSNDDDDWETPANSIPDSAQSPPQEEQTVNPHHQPRTPTSRFSDAPLSPTDDSPSSPVGSFGAAAEAGTKVIPV